MRPTTVAALGLGVCLLGAARPAHARSVEDCQLAWGQATRSYLNGKQTGPQDADFKAACDLDAKGDKEAARVEAVMVATRALAKVGDELCPRFLKYYAGVKNPAAACSAAGGEDAQAFKEAVSQALPAPGQGAPSKPASHKGKKKG